VPVRILALGDRDPQFLTHREIDATLALFGGSWTATDSALAGTLDGAAGVWLLPGTPYRDDEAASAAAAHCVESGTPFLGTCGGFQCHFCGLGVADGYLDAIRRAGAVVSAHGDDAPVEAVELPSHPFFIGTAFQPQVGVSETGRLPALLRGFLGAARERFAPV